MRLGLNMLLIASEELATPRDDLATARKEELLRLLTAQVPQILSSLTAILESVMEKQRKLHQGKVSTPPPSPSQGTAGEGTPEDASSSAASKAMFTTSPVHDGSLLHSASHR